MWARSWMCPGEVSGVAVPPGRAVMLRAEAVVAVLGAQRPCYAHPRDRPVSGPWFLLQEQGRQAVGWFAPSPLPVAWPIKLLPFGPFWAELQESVQLPSDPVCQCRGSAPGQRKPSCSRVWLSSPLKQEQ